ncbi:hypothetical protein NFI96_021883, partial [Prochilodus magdalenae]
CLGTSDNLVWSLFPKLKLAVEKNKPALAEKYLEKARDWITEVIDEVDRIIKRYDALKKQVDQSISDIIAEKQKRDRESAQLLQQNEGIQEKINTLKETLEETRKKLADTEQLTEDKHRELQNSVTNDPRLRKAARCYDMVSVWVMFKPAITKIVLDLVSSLGTAEKTKDLQSELERLSSQKAALKEKEWDVQIQITEWQMQQARLEIEQGSIPCPGNLRGVKKNLSKIQNIFINLKNFWEMVHKNLSKLSVDPDLKEDFLKTIEKAATVWGCFGGSCSKAVEVFRGQSKDAYHFLETDPSSLSQDVFQREYGRVKKQLKLIKVYSGEYNYNQITQPKPE